MENLTSKYGIFWIPGNDSFLSMIQNWKERLKAIEPDAGYLNHPVHSTLFVFNAAENKEPAIVNSLRAFCGTLQPIRTRPVRWYVFYNDLLTGGDTLMVELEKSSQLQSLQKDLADLVQPFRSGDLTYDTDWKNEFLVSYNKYGFPFVGNHWFPHVTVGSARNNGKPIVMEAINHSINLPESNINSIFLYKILGDRHDLVTEIFFSK